MTGRMPRTLYSVLAVTLGAVLFSCGRAAATTEFCPAVLDYAPVASAANATTYGIQLRALSQRRVAVTIAFDTSAGWFTADLAQTSLSPNVRTMPLKYPVDIGLATSPVGYVRFPSAVHVNHAFVTSAQSFGDIFGWSARGTVTCPLAPEAWAEPKNSLADLGALTAPPDDTSTIIALKRRSPMESAECADAFVQSTVTKAARAAYPDAARAVGASGSAVIGVALNPDGSVADTWVSGTTNDQTLDAAALDAAQRSTFSGARAYCQAVPSIFYFVATFDPRYPQD